MARSELFLGRKVHLIEFVDDEELGIHQVLAAEDAFLRQDVHRDPVGLRFLAGMRDDGAAFPKPAQQAAAGFVDERQGRHYNNDLSEFLGSHDLVDDEALAGTC